jgi:hypothetical protein
LTHSNSAFLIAISPDEKVELLIYSVTVFFKLSFNPIKARGPNATFLVTDSYFISPASKFLIEFILWIYSARVY